MLTCPHFLEIFTRFLKYFRWCFSTSGSAWRNLKCTIRFRIGLVIEVWYFRMRVPRFSSRINSEVIFHFEMNLIRIGFVDLTDAHRFCSTKHAKRTGYEFFEW
jgi:hypothetical protein